MKLLFRYYYSAVCKETQEGYFFIYESEKGESVLGQMQTCLVQASHMITVKVPKHSEQRVLFQPWSFGGQAKNQVLTGLLLHGCIYHALF